MSKNYTLDGIGENIEFGKGGPRIKNNSGVMEVKNAADTDLVPLGVGDGSAANDAATKGQLDAATGVQIRKVDFAYNTSSPFNIGAQLPANSTVVGFLIQVDTIFDGTTPKVELGNSGTPDGIAQDTESDLTVVGVNTGEKWVEYTPATQLLGTLTLSGATQGAGSVLIKFVE